VTSDDYASSSTDYRGLEALRALVSQSNNQHGIDGVEWESALRIASDRSVAAITAELHARASQSSQLVSAMRDAARMVLDARLNKRSLDQLEKLEKQAARLTTAGIAVSAMLGLASLAVAIF